nr:reverse transcriptase domain-containing protein [Tanacetum cinerariifolium]
MTRMVKEQGGINQIIHEDFQNCLFACFISQEEPKKVLQAFKDPSWIEAMQEKLLHFKLQKVWVLLDLPKGKKDILKKKSAFLYGTIEEEVYVRQPLGFEDLDYPDKVYKVVKALYVLHQAPIAALIDVFEGELTLPVGKETITFNLDQTSRYSANYSDMTAKRIDVIDMACEEYSQKVLGFSDVISSSNPTPYYDPIVSTTSLNLTPFKNSDFLLEEGDILLLEAFLNDDPSLLPPNQENYMSEVRKELKIYEAKSDKYSIDEPPEVELKDLPPHLEYAFLEGDDKLPVIIEKDLSVEEKTALITVLKSHKRAIAWKLSNIKGINPEFCTHTILVDENFEPVVQH